MKPCKLAFAIGLISAQTLLNHSAVADHSDLPEVVVQGRYTTIDFSYTRNAEKLQQPDSSALLSTIPGANINRNGPLTGIAQYRGAYGNRVSVAIDGASFVSGGPNSMDTPLSYIPGGLLEELRVSRGIASVSSAQESLGGHIDVSSKRGEFGMGSDFETHAAIKSDYSEQNDGSSNSVMAYLTNNRHKLGFNASYDHGDNSQYDGNDEIPNSFYERERYNLFYGYQGDSSGFNINIGRSETDDSGTPALPMDILFINSDLVSADAFTTIGDTRLEAKVAYSHADHGMDNTSHRTAPTMTMMMMGMPMTMPMNRYAHATGRKVSYQLQAITPLFDGELTVGVDRSETVHDTQVSDPSNAAFSVHSFNNAEREILGAFAEWKNDWEQWSVEVGLRHNRVDSDTDNISHSGFSTMSMMGMGSPSMNDVVNGLANNFNSADLSQRDDNLDAVFKLAYHLNSEVTLGLGLAQKHRAPTYQERYLWLPLQSTGGLADGRNYTGNTELNSERAREINLGIDWRSAGNYLSLQGFYRDVDDYIQGTPNSGMGIDMNANMIANMMGGQDALQFNNVEAEVYGADLGYGFQLNEHFRLDGTLSYVRGKRSDISDDLYRIAPFNHRVSLSYQANDYSLALESEIYQQQDHVSSYNSEEETSGYGLLHLRGQLQLNEQLSLSAGVENLLDRAHQSHLSGYNRVQGGDIASGERLFGTGRSAYFNISYSW